MATLQGDVNTTDVTYAPARAPVPEPIPMLLICPGVLTDADGRQRVCGARHVDRGEFATKSHHTHSCQHCGHTWRPAVVPTVGVQFLPGFKDKDGS